MESKLWEGLSKLGNDRSTYRDWKAAFKSLYKQVAKQKAWRPILQYLEEPLTMRKDRVGVSEVIEYKTNRPEAIEVGMSQQSILDVADEWDRILHQKTADESHASVYWRRSKEDYTMTQHTVNSWTA